MKNPSRYEVHLAGKRAFLQLWITCAVIALAVVLASVLTRSVVAVPVFAVAVLVAIVLATHMVMYGEFEAMLRSMSATERTARLEQARGRAAQREVAKSLAFASNRHL